MDKSLITTIITIITAIIILFQSEIAGYRLLYCPENEPYKIKKNVYHQITNFN